MHAKGEQTRRQILHEALATASTEGLTGLTIGGLAKKVGMSKSGLFAHFQSKDQLQVEVLREAVERFRAEVVLPAIRLPRGEPRVRQLFKRWLRWQEAPFLPGGCPLVAAAKELDDQEGPARETLAGSQRAWLETLAKAAKIAVDEGHFRADLDTAQFAFEEHALMLGYHFQSRLLRNRAAGRRVAQGFERLLDQARS